MRPLLRLFPTGWRERYGAEFAEQFEAAGGYGKWLDALSVAASLRWAEFGRSSIAPMAALLSALALVSCCDLALGVGSDERIGVHLASHWWGAPFVGALAMSATLVLFALAAMSTTRRLRPAVLLACALGAGAFVGSSALAAISLELAATGAGVGLTVAAGSARWWIRTPLGRADMLAAVAVPLVVLLGLRSASTPLGPAVLLGVMGLLLATRLPSGAQA